MNRLFAAVGAAATIAVLVTALFVADTGSASAGAGVTVSTTVNVHTVTVLSARTAGGNSILDLRYDGDKTGLWSWDVTARLVIHADGTWTAHGHGTFSGPAGDCGNVSGEWEEVSQGTVNPDGTLKGSGHAHSIDESANPGGFRFSEDWAIDGMTGPTTITYACR